jgi:hypothetical protein
MINILKTSAEPENAGRFASYELGSCIIASSAATSRTLTRRYLFSMLVLCLTVSSIAAIAHAQGLPPTGVKTTAHSTFWSLEGSGSNAAPAPYLVIGMADRGDTRSYGTFGIPEDEATNPSARDTITREIGPAPSANRTETIESGPLKLSSLLEPTSEVRGLTKFRPQQTSRGTVQRPPGQTGTSAYSLLDDTSVPGSFLYGYQPNYLPSKEWSADNELFTHDAGQAPRPLMQLGFGDWRLPVMLSSATVSR